MKKIFLIFLILFYFVKKNNTNTTPSDLKIILGPIIGKVTTTTARIMIEFNKSAPIIITLTKSTDLNKKYYKQLEVTPNFPYVFSFSDLEPKTKYLVSISPNLKTISGKNSSFTTLSGVLSETQPSNFIVLSCNDVYFGNLIPISANLWTDLANKANYGEITYLIHMGDQIYTDMSGGVNNPYLDSKSLLTNINYKDYSLFTDIIRSKISTYYIKTWTVQPTAETLSLVPSLMIFDDHEFGNNFGFHNTNYNDPTSFDYFFFVQARYVYYKYQRQLREDIDFANFEKTGEEYYFEILNEVGFFFFEYRGVKTFHKNAKDYKDISMLGYSQTETFNRVFSEKGDFNKVKASIIVSTNPMMMFSQEYVRMIAATIVDYKEFWQYESQTELQRVLKTLDTWKNNVPGREIFFISGDIHAAGHTQICYNNKPWAKQFIASGLNTVEVIIAEIYNDDITLSLNRKMDGGYTFIHHDFINIKNYGQLVIKPVISNGVDTVSIVANVVSSTGKGLNPFKTEKSFSNTEFTMKEKIGCSSNFISFGLLVISVLLTILL